jgi:hypothetical protein
VDWTSSRDAALAEHHAEAARNVGGADGLDEVFDRIERMAAQRSTALIVRTTTGEVERSYRELTAALDVAENRASQHR